MTCGKQMTEERERAQPQGDDNDSRRATEYYYGCSTEGDDLSAWLKQTINNFFLRGSVDG